MTVAGGDAKAKRKCFDWMDTSTWREHAVKNVAKGHVYEDFASDPAVDANLRAHLDKSLGESKSFWGTWAEGCYGKKICDDFTSRLETCKDPSAEATLVNEFIIARKEAAAERLKEADFPPLAMMYGVSEPTGEVAVYNEKSNSFSFPMDTPGVNTFPGDGRITHQRLQPRDWPWQIPEYRSEITHSKQINDIEVLNTALADLRKAYDVRVKGETVETASA